MFYHRIKAKKETPKAIVATARKIAAVFYKLVKEKVKFNPIPIEKYMDGFKEYQIKKLKGEAQNIGLQMLEV
ncbi:MAG: hypothetical protein ABIP68_04135 [Ferruginibacter sp.]